MLEFLVYSILPFLFILGFCITIHEFGHFLVAKLFHIPVEKFSIGYGPPLFSRKIGETDFRIAYLPFGGYVKIAGEDEGEILKKKKTLSDEHETLEVQSERIVQKATDHRTGDTEKHQTDALPGFYDVAIHKRILVVLAGPLFNIFSALMVVMLSLSAFGLMMDPYTRINVEEGSYAYRSGFMGGDSIVSANETSIRSWEEFEDILSRNVDEEITVILVRNGSELSRTLHVSNDSLGLTNIVPPFLGTVKRGGPAHKAGMKKGDRVLRIDNTEISTWYEMYDIISKAKGVELLFEWQHDNEIKTAYVTPKSRYDYITEDSVGKIDVFKPLKRKYVSLGEIFSLSIKQTAFLIGRTLQIFYQLLSRRISAKQIGGPIAIFKLSAESAQWGFQYLFGLLIIISINLGIINLFPIPALDGGHILIGMIEGIRRKRFSRRTIIITQQIGYAIILLLIAFVTFNDITR